MTTTQKERIERLEDAVGVLTWWLYQLHSLGLNDVWGINAIIEDGEKWPSKRHAELSDAAISSHQPSGLTLRELKFDATKP